MRELFERFASRIGGEPDLRGVVLAVSRIPYGRPSDRTPETVLREWRGTCSTKHLLLAHLIGERWPQHPVELWHRPYAVTGDLARERWGEEVADVLPSEGLVDVHTFATVRIDDEDVPVDVTFPIDDWDGRSPLPLHCGPGTDIPAGADPLRSKARLVAEHCDPSVREPFITALAHAQDDERRPAEALRIALCGPEGADEVRRLTQIAFRPYDRLDPPSGAARETIERVRDDLARGGGAIGELDGRPVACLRWEVDPDGAFHVRRLAVLPELQGRGIARAMMAWAEEEARRRGCHGVSVGVRVALPDNLAFYRRLGYEVTAEHRHEGYDRTTWLALRKELR